MFYDDSWHNPFMFNVSTTGDTYSEMEIPLTAEMMETQFYVRFRNGLSNPDQYLDIDNVELYGIK